MFNLKKIVDSTSSLTFHRKSCIAIRKYWQDILIVFFLAALVGLASYHLAQSIDPGIVSFESVNTWFDADPVRVFSAMTSARSNEHLRNKVHPLFSLIAYPPAILLRKVLGIESLTAVKFVFAGVTALWISALFTTLRLIGCLRLDATLFSLLGLSSAASVFWFSVPETYSFGSLSILLALGFVALAELRQFSFICYTAVSTLTLSFTTTNWMVGILATGVNHRWKKVIQITATAYLLTTVLWFLEKKAFPKTQFFVGDSEEGAYLIRPDLRHLLQVAQSFFLHTMVMPAIKLVENDKAFQDLGWPMMSVQASPLGSGSLLGTVSIWLWIALLGLGLWGLFSIKKHLKLRIVIGLALLGQLALHAVYGRETFLYSLHFAPLLVVLAALSVLTRVRPLALVLVLILTLTVGINNGLQFSKATTVVQNNGPQRHQVQAQMRLRPSDPWSRGSGHIVLAAPGSQEVDKAYHEPGGSFSPAVGSFGVSFWLTDASGNLKATSDRIPLNEIDQQFTWKEGHTIPGILTKTNYYEALWQAQAPKDWALDLKTQTNPNSKSVLVIRSVGPAGGPINALNWDGKQLLINDRWSVTVTPTPKVYLGDEGRQGWIKEQSTIAQWKGEQGWGYARFELGDRQDWRVTIHDLSPSNPVNSPIQTSTQANVELNLPDQQFTESFKAQVAHIKMGLVGKETRPGEPTNYPLAWQRDGAYEVVALARAGQLQTAKELSTNFAEHDFFGGFGAEADAPGLSLWALEEVAVRLKQTEYDQWLWPHIRRKAAFILRMMTTTEPIRQPFEGPVVPSYKDNPDLTLVAEPAQNGLIVGRMDWHRPLLFVNAVSYRGLLDAAALAERVNQPADAQRWRDAAAKLQQSWEKAFKSPEIENERTFVSSLWPTWIAASDQNQERFKQALQARWSKLRDAQGGFKSSPLWTYFDIAEAHQWLLLNQPERVWSTLRWFWNHQTSPGLYTWWEGNGEENTFRRWERIRGWVNPPNVTPHYWTAAEMLSLQLDMLAYTDLSTKQPTVVIGAGIPSNWLSQPMSVRGLPMPFGKLDWNWNGQQMQVTISGKPVNVQLGSSFSKGTPLKVEQREL